MKESKKIQSKSQIKKYIIIGLGRFGKALTKELALNSRSEVMAIDKCEEAVNSVREYVTHCAVADATDEKVMTSIGLKNFDVAVICIANDMESSILISLLCKQFGVPYVVAKAKSEKHKAVLEKIGLDLVIIPEQEMGRKLALKLLNPVASEVFDLGKNMSIVEIFVPGAWNNKNMLELDIRKKYKVNALLIHRQEELIANVSGETVVKEGDSMVVAGYSTDLEKLSNRINKLSQG